MPTKIQILSILAFLSALGGGGYYLSESNKPNEIKSKKEKLIKKKHLNGHYKEFWFDSDINETIDTKLIGVDEPKYTVVFNSADVSDNTFNNKILKLLKVDNISNLVKDIDFNKSWWDWAYERKYLTRDPLTKLDPLFQDLTWKGNRTLNKACAQAYSSTEDKYKFEDSYLLKNISQFCVKGPKPIDISEPRVTIGSGKAENEYKNGVLSIQQNKQILISNENSNKYWWIWFYENSAKKTIKNSIAPFNTVTSGYGTTSSSLNKACDAAYKETHNKLKESSGKLLEEIKKYCSDGESSHTLILPPVPKPTKGPETLTTTDTSTGDYSLKLISYVQTDHVSLFLKDSENNKGWWEWSHDARYLEQKNSEQLDEIFKNIEHKYHDSESKSLNKACHEAYKQERSKYTFKDSYLLKNILDFCTREGTQESAIEPTVTTFSDVTDVNQLSSDNKNGVLKEEKSRKASVKSMDTNEPWWNWSFYYNFLKDSTKDDEIFKDVDKGYDSGNDNKALNNACLEAYKKPYDSIKTNNFHKLIEKYCMGGVFKRNFTWD